MPASCNARRLAVNIVATWVLVAAAPAVQASYALAEQKGCLGCHGVDRAKVGPAYQEVAARYAGQPGEARRLADKVRQGGKGVWGEVAMPPHSKVSAAEAKRLVDWVLGLKSGK